MSPLVAISMQVWIVLIVILVVDMFAVFFGMSFLRGRRAREAEAGPGMPEEQVVKGPRPVSRREFFRRSLLLSFAVFAAEFGAATIAFLWPNLKGGFGSVINAGKLADIKAEIAASNQPYYFGQGRFYLVPYEGTPAGGVDYEAEGVASDGIMPLYQRCVHLGCRVPFCLQSQWFECPCHGSKYNEAGEYKLGPAPRGMDRFQVEVDGSGNVLVDTSEVILGPPRGTDTIDEPPQGPYCVAPG